MIVWLLLTSAVCGVTRAAMVDRSSEAAKEERDRGVCDGVGRDDEAAEAADADDASDASAEGVVMIVVTHTHTHRHKFKKACATFIYIYILLMD